MKSLPTTRNAPRKTQNTIKTQRTAAKVGMTASMAVLVWSALSRSRKFRAYHTLAGVALIAFTAWHMALYKSNGKKSEE